MVGQTVKGEEADYKSALEKRMAAGLSGLTSERDFRGVTG